MTRTPNPKQDTRPVQNTVSIMPSPSAWPGPNMSGSTIVGSRGAIPPTQRGEKMPRKGLERAPLITHAQGKVDMGLTASASQVLVYSKPKFGLDISYVENPPRLGKTSTSIFSNDDYSLRLAHSVVTIYDRQFMMRNSVSST